ILLAGKFTLFSNQSRYGLVRLWGDSGSVRPLLSIQATHPALILDWAGSFTLQSATNVSGAYSDVSGNPSPPYTVPNQEARQFFRLRN
ncbi:MAG TPA: hypothetical protein VNZ22_19090, partial [Bacillota bacterium]|nr:hypothetical protein [Bacillota bacterium]